MKRSFAWLVVGLLATTASSAWAATSSYQEGFILLGFALLLVGPAWALLLAYLVRRSKVLWPALSLVSPFLVYQGLTLLRDGYDALGGPTLPGHFPYWRMFAAATAPIWLPTLGLWATTASAKRARAQR